MTDFATAPDELLRHAGFLRRLALRLVRDPGLADDVVQDTMVAALAEPAPRRDRLRAWLATVARRFALRRIRGEARRLRRDAAVARTVAVEGDVDSAAQETVLRDVTAAVLALREPYRATILARFYEDATPNEIAARSGVPLSTVHSRIRRGVEELRWRLDRTVPGGRDAWMGGLVSLTPLLHTALMTSQKKLIAVVVVLLVGSVCLLFANRDDDETVRGRGKVSAPVGTSASLEDVSRPDGADEVGEERMQLAARATEPVQPVKHPGRAAIVVQATWIEKGGRPAAGRTICILPWDDSRPLCQMRDMVTDARGQIRLDDLAPGSVMLYGDLGGSMRVTAAADVTTPIEFVFPEGIELRGTVLDPHGGPVAGATVWLSDYANDVDGHSITTTGPAGRFVVEHVGKARWVGAFAQGWGPCRLYQLEGAPGSKRDLVLRLTAEHASVQGEVVGPAGNPVTGARVRLEQARRGTTHDVAGLPLGDLPPREATTGDDGRFAFAGLEPGKTVVMVRHDALGSFRAGFSLAPGQRHDRQVRLGKSPGVRGVVRDAAGDPVAGADVRQGPHARFLASLVRTDKQGRFFLTNLPPGPIRFSVEKKLVGKAQIEFVATAGVVETWNPTLSAGRRLRGRIVDGDNRPRVGFNIYAISNQIVPVGTRLWSRSAETDGEGRFEIIGCPDATVDLEIRGVQYTRAPLHRVRHHAPDGVERVIVIADSGLPTSSLRGTLVDASGRPAVGLLRALPRGGGMPSRVHVTAGRFHFEAMHTGRYRLFFEPAGRSGLTLDNVELSRGQALDVGRLELPGIGTLSVSVDGRPGAGAPFERVSFAPSGGGDRSQFQPWHGPIVIEAGKPARLDLHAGRYLLRASGAGVAEERVPFVVEAGQPVCVDLNPVAGVEVVVTGVFAAGHEMTPVMCAIYDKSGTAVVYERLLPGVGRTASWSKRLRPGTYEIRCNEIIDGRLQPGKRPKTLWKARTPLVVPEDRPRMEVRVVLQKRGL